MATATPQPDPASAAVPPSVVGEDALARLHRDGFCVLPSVIPDDLLTLLRDECQGFIDRKDAEMDAAGTDTIGISHRGKRYFVAQCYQQRPVLGRFLFSRLMASICRQALGPDVWLFHDQYVVKGAEQGMKFAWHQDSGYVLANGGDPAHRPYLSCWCPLDDVSEANGTVYLLPFDKAGTRTVIPHRRDPATNDWVGYFGTETGEAVDVPAGSIALFTSTTFHRSGPNLTPAMRRVFLAQYAAEPLKTADGTGLWGQAVPFLKDGVAVARADGGTA